LNISNILNEVGFKEFISLDLETTGLNVDKDEIIEISAIKFINGIYDSEFTTLIKPKSQIPKQIIDLTVLVMKWLMVRIN